MTKFTKGKVKKSKPVTQAKPETTTAMDYFTEENARIEIVSLKEHEVASMQVVNDKGEQHHFGIEEYVISKPSYEEVFEDIDARVTALANKFREEIPNGRPYIRITHRQGKLIQQLDDKYVAVVSVAALADPYYEAPVSEAVAEPVPDNEARPMPEMPQEPAQDAEPINGAKATPEGMPTLTFSEAVALMQAANVKITRLGWKGVSFVYLCQSWAYAPQEGVSGAEDANIAPCFVRYIDGVNHTGWLPNFDDLTTKCWVVVK